MKSNLRIIYNIGNCRFDLPIGNALGVYRTNKYNILKNYNKKTVIKFEIYRKFWEVKKGGGTTGRIRTDTP